MWNLLIGIGVGALVAMALLLIYEAATAKKLPQIPSPYGMIDVPPDHELREGRDAHPQLCSCVDPQSDGGVCSRCGSYIFNEIAGKNDD